MKIQSPVLAGQVLPEGAVRLLRDQDEAVPPVDAAGRAGHVVPDAHHAADRTAVQLGDPGPLPAGVVFSA
ncbi:hypothetical protein [Streptomyces sp. NPDC015242]|uniref:hypothetical protein n=1 Tax=Streptomyces sp. NPDC015242 TaxID=3364951 RepID=UPI0036F4FB58